MKNYRKHIDDFFREKLGNYSETPPADVWDGLAERLDGMQPSAGLPNRWLLHVAIGSMLVLLGVSLVKKTHNDPGTQDIIVSENVAKTPSVQSAGATLKSERPGSPIAENSAQGTASKTVSADKNETNANLANDRNTGSYAASANGDKRSSNNLPAADKKAHKHSKQGNISSSANYIGSSISDDRETVATVSGSHGPDVQVMEAQGKATQPAVPAALKPEVSDKKETPANTAANKQAITTEKPGFSRFELGFKAGMEKGLNDFAATKYVVAPYLQYNLTPRFSIMVQPAVKSVTISDENIGKPQIYNDPGAPEQPVAGPEVTISRGPKTTYYATYTYRQTFDSIVKSYTYGGTRTEFEVPILVKYSITPRAAVYGGVSINYSRLAGITEHTYSKSVTISKDRTDSSATGYPQALPPSSVIQLPGSSYSEYKGPLYSAPQGSLLRCGYMIGFSYEYTSRWLVDGLIQQSPFKSDVQGGYNVNVPFSSTYFRLTIGYKIIK